MRAPPSSLGLGMSAIFPVAPRSSPLTVIWMHQGLPCQALAPGTFLSSLILALSSLTLSPVC